MPRTKSVQTRRNEYEKALRKVEQIREQMRGPDGSHIPFDDLDPAVAEAEHLACADLQAAQHALKHG